jgi:hypothetical protein
MKNVGKRTEGKYVLEYYFMTLEETATNSIIDSEIS